MENWWIYLIIVVAVVVLIWWFFTRDSKRSEQPPARRSVQMAGQEEPAPQTAARLHVAAAPPVEEQFAPELSVSADTFAVGDQALVEAPAAAPNDDLTIIEGIGPKVNELLQKAGITTFAGLSEANPAAIAEILSANHLRMLDPASWPEQARLAAAGDEAGLKALQDRLKGGR